MKFFYNTNFTLPKQSQRSRSILQDGSRSLGLCWKEKKSCLITKEIWYLLMQGLGFFVSEFLALSIESRDGISRAVLKTND